MLRSVDVSKIGKIPDFSKKFNMNFKNEQKSSPIEVQDCILNDANRLSDEEVEVK